MEIQSVPDYHFTRKHSINQLSNLIVPSVQKRQITHLISFYLHGPSVLFLTDIKCISVQMSLEARFILKTHLILPTPAL